LGVVVVGVVVVVAVVIDAGVPGVVPETVVGVASMVLL
jgi:hypothetical protein